MSSTSKKFTVKVGKERADNTETVSSPHTFAPMGGAEGALPGELVDKPTISSVKIYPNEAIQGSSAVANNALHNTTADSAKHNSAAWVDKLTFTIDGITPPMANLIRRAILTEVPTMAFDRILIEENDGVVLDELLSHSIGMVPLVAPVEQFQFVSSADVAQSPPLPTIPSTNSFIPDPSKVICFELDVTGDRFQAQTVVYSGMLKWKNLDGIQAKLTEKDIHLVHNDIPIAKLGPGQRIKLTAYALKGLGVSHAKWQPASACFYKLKTTVTINQDVLASKEDPKSMAKKLVKACPMRVFELEDLTAVVADSSRCTLCRECLADPFEGIVTVEKSKSIVEFVIESMGQYPSSQLLPVAMKVFAERCRKLAKHVETEPVDTKPSSE